VRSFRSEEDGLVEPLVELKLDQEHHQDLRDHQDDEEINGGGEVDSEKDDKENTTKHEASHKNGSNAEDELLGLADSFRRHFEQSKAHEPKYYTKNKCKENNNRLINDREGVRIRVQSLIGRRDTTRAYIHLLVSGENVFRIHDSDDGKETPYQKVGNRHGHPKSAVRFPKEKCTFP